jgi:broad specificity phosphatase PhoE
MAQEVWAVRHGQRQDTVDPDWELTAARIHDPGLTELGRWQAWRCGRYFAERGIEFEAVYCSPFLRAVQTTAEIYGEIGHGARLEPGLGEHRNAEWFDSEPETLSHRTLADYFEPIQHDHDPFVVPEFPEEHHEAETRAGETARRIVDAHDGPVLMVGHGLTIGGVVRGLVGSTEGVDAPLCGLTRIENRDGEWKLDFSGAVDHLE